MTLSSPVLQLHMEKQSKREHFLRGFLHPNEHYTAIYRVCFQNYTGEKKEVTKEPDQNGIQKHLVIISRLGRLSEPWQGQGARIRREKHRINRKQRQHKQLTFLINPRWMANREEDGVKQTATSAQDEMLICIQETRGTEISEPHVRRSQCALLRFNRRPDIALKGHIRNECVCTTVPGQKRGCVGSESMTELC